MPSPVGGQVGGAVEDLVALRASELDVDYPRTSVRGQAEGIVVLVLAELADVVSDLVLDLGYLCPSFLCNDNNIEAGVYVSRFDRQGMVRRREHIVVLVVYVSNKCPGHRRALVLVEVQLPGDFSLLGGFRLGVGVVCCPLLRGLVAGGRFGSGLFDRAV